MTKIINYYFECTQLLLDPITIMAEALPTALQIFNQRLLAAHCWSEDEAKNQFQKIHETYGDDDDDDFARAIAISNAQLQYVGLEIVAISIRDPNTENGATTPTRHYAMINSFPDDVAKQSFQSVLFQPPSQQAYIRAVYETLVEAKGSGVPRNTLLNVKNNIQQKAAEGNNNNNISLSVAEDALDKLIEEKWLIVQGKGRNANAFIGPRSYCELSYLLTEEFGMDKEDLPQQIYHRL
jgi:hypothetical protein